MSLTINWREGLDMNIQMHTPDLDNQTLKSVILDINDVAD